MVGKAKAKRTSLNEAPARLNYYSNTVAADTGCKETKLRY